MKLGRIATQILRCGLPFVAVVSAYIALSVYMLDDYDKVRLTGYVAEQLEHMLMSLTLLIGGAFLFDANEKLGSR